MHSPRKPFFTLTAEDLMSRDVIAIQEEMPLTAAARVLSRAQISGAPVVNAAGVCVGVVSATDFLRLANRDTRLAPVTCATPLCVCSDWQVLEIHELPVDEVRRHMTADPVTVRTDTSVGQVARLMLDAHIHRVIVVDVQGRPIGIVSSTDLIAAIGQSESAGGVETGSPSVCESGHARSKPHSVPPVRQPSSGRGAGFCS
jgi:CBS domain-containing protein